ncbi:unnamed protein product [Gongylonema pulchrum]|uniref:Uncharacterized protein n=1 Tax=Gongylonema pulchrum TaxID=637853 RepID=A0A3P7NGE5_9BILA|nr:unnamed protein product [Gongylonema pulchrum]
MVIGISVVVFFIIIVNCFTLRVYLKENKDDRSFHEQEFTYSDHRSFRYGGGRSPQHGVLSDDSIWDADCSTIEFQL